MNIQWYPGHMAKAVRLMKQQLSNVDIVLVVGDARAVKASVNMDFIRVLGNKKYIKVFNKACLADEKINEEWLEFYKKSSQKVFFTDCMSKYGIPQLTQYLSSLKDKLRFSREIRVMVTGVPNVGKSMLINTIAGRAAAVTENRPGVTRANKWIKCQGFYLLDTPGVLPAKIDSEKDAVALAAIGSIKETVFDAEQVSFEIIKFLMENYHQNLVERYSLDEMDHDYLSVYENIGRKRGFIKKGGGIDYERLSAAILKEAGSSLIARISFDRPEDMTCNLK